MSTKKIGILSILAILFILLSPTATSAAKRVSQNFVGNINYFSLKDDKAMIFSDGKFYYSEQPSVAKDWQTIKVTAQTNYFLPVKAISFKSYDYVISGGYYNGGEDWLSVDPMENEIWRVKNSNPKTLKKVFSLPNWYVDGGQVQIFYFRDLIVFKDALYASDPQGFIWKSAEGINWKKITVSGLPENISPDSLTATDETLYGVFINTIYFSKNGKTWQKLSGNYEQYNYGANVEVISSNNQTYIKLWRFMSESGEQEFILWRINKSGSIKRVYTDNQDNLVLVGSEATYLAKQNADEKTYAIYKSADGKKFVKKSSVPGRPDSLTEVNGKILLLLSNLDNAGTYLYRLEALTR